MPFDTVDLYQPLMGPSDRLVRSPVRPRRAIQLAKLLAALSGRDVFYDGTAVALNQLALLEAYEGNHANAAALCDAQVAYWKSVAASQPRYLAFAIQPLINIVRLERWKATTNGPVSLYRDLSPERRGLCGPLQARHGIALSFDQICQADSAQGYGELLNNVYWREYSRSLLQSGRTEQLQVLLAQGLAMPLSGFVRLALLEILLLQQTRAGKHHSAGRLLKTLAIDPGSPYWLHFKVLEMYLALTSSTAGGATLACEVVLAAGQEKHIARTGYGLNLLFDISKVFRELGRATDEHRLLTLTERSAVQLNDEVIQFEALDRLATLDGGAGAALGRRFAHSSYALIRKRLGLAAVQPDPLSALLMRAAPHLARGDASACAAVLQAGNADARTMLAEA